MNNFSTNLKIKKWGINILMSPSITRFAVKVNIYLERGGLNNILPGRIYCNLSKSYTSLFNIENRCMFVYFWKFLFS